MNAFRVSKHPSPNPVPHKTFVILAAFALAAFVACSDDASTASSSGAATACTLPKVQGPAAACCKGYGADACGAGLFCDAFDGRTASTCYVNRGRITGETCNADAQCTTNKCSSEGFCAAAPLATCKAEWGCNDFVQSKHYVCAEGTCQPASASTGCVDSSDCGDALVCQSGKCMTGTTLVGASCTQSAECASAHCFQGKCDCSKQNDAGCPSGKMCSGGGSSLWGNTCDQALTPGGGACKRNETCASRICANYICEGISGGTCVESAGCAATPTQDQCIAGICKSTLYYAGGVCSTSAQCVTGQCYKGACQCSKTDNSGCPSGKTCSGSTHAIWGTTCSL